MLKKLRSREIWIEKPSIKWFLGPNFARFGLFELFGLFKLFELSKLRKLWKLKSRRIWTEKPSSRGFLSSNSAPPQIQFSILRSRLPRERKIENWILGGLIHVTPVGARSLACNAHESAHPSVLRPWGLAAFHVSPSHLSVREEECPSSSVQGEDMGQAMSSPYREEAGPSYSPIGMGRAFLFLVLLRHISREAWKRNNISRTHTIFLKF